MPGFALRCVVSGWCPWNQPTIIVINSQMHLCLTMACLLLNFPLDSRQHSAVRMTGWALYGRNVIPLACNMLVTCLPTCKCRCVSCFGATHDTFTTLHPGTAVDMTMEHVLTRTGVHPTPFRHTARSRRASRHACSDCRVQPWQRSHEKDRNVVARAQAPVDIEEVRAADVSTIAIATNFTHTFGRSIPAEVLMWRDTCRRRTTSMRRWTRRRRS